MQMTECTATHDYPREEICAMIEFHNGKTCALMHNRLAVHWIYMLNEALLTSNQQVWRTSISSYLVC